MAGTERRFKKRACVPGQKRDAARYAIGTMYASGVIPGSEKLDQVKLLSKRSPFASSRFLELNRVTREREQKAEQRNH